MFLSTKVSGKLYSLHGDLNDFYLGKYPVEHRLKYRMVHVHTFRHKTTLMIKLYQVGAR